MVYFLATCESTSIINAPNRCCSCEFYLQKMPGDSDFLVVV